MKALPLRTMASFFVLFAASTLAHAEDKLPAKQVIAAIQTAVAAYPGQIKDVDIGKEDGKGIVQVKIENKKGDDETIKVDAENNKVIK
jgi:uncharacterized membrane protein YkoI